jgi:hypothetical protein
MGGFRVDFNSWQDFDAFVHDVKFRNRFVHSLEVIKFLANIKHTLPSRERLFAAGGILYRAQVGHEEFEDEGQIIISGYSEERMKPIPFQGSEGRANPKGISYLYLSNDESTALAELRPHLGVRLSSAQFEANKELKLLDCYSVNNFHSYVSCIFSPPTTQNEIANAIWSRINEAFTKPVTNTDQRSDYVPTQILAEFFKAEGFDGICFKSSLGPGHNFILFRPDDAKLVSCKVMETKSIYFEFEECGNQYWTTSK